MARSASGFDAGFPGPLAAVPTEPAKLPAVAIHAVEGRRRDWPDGEASAGAFCANRPADPNAVSLCEPQLKAAPPAENRSSCEPQFSVTVAWSEASDAADEFPAQPPNPP
jgi:hypothetical protein